MHHGLETPEDRHRIILIAEAKIVDEAPDYEMGYRLPCEGETIIIVVIIISIRSVNLISKPAGNPVDRTATRWGPRYMAQTVIA